MVTVEQVNAQRVQIEGALLGFAQEMTDAGLSVDAFILALLNTKASAVRQRYGPLKGEMLMHDAARRVGGLAEPVEDVDVGGVH